MSGKALAAGIFGSPTASALSLNAAFVLMLVLAAAMPAVAQEGTTSKKTGRTVAAIVDGKRIYADEVERTLQATLKGRKVAPQAMAVLEAQLLARMVDQQLVKTHLQGSEYEAAKSEVDAAVAEFNSKLAAKNVSLEATLKARNLTAADLRDQAAWELTWRNYVAKHITDERLERYFNEHRKQFDGSQVEASHILLRPEAGGDAAATAKLVSRAGNLRHLITTSNITFAEAARKYSDGPSGKQGGKLGSFPRHGVMAEAFSRAAFALDVGEVSQPVRTRFGIHLIQVTGIEPGDKKWTDARKQLTAPLTQDLFNRLAEKSRQDADIQYTGDSPYIDPVTKKLVLPAAAEE